MITELEIDNEIREEVIEIMSEFFEFQKKVEINGNKNRKKKVVFDFEINEFINWDEDRINRILFEK